MPEPTMQGGEEFVPHVTLDVTDPFDPPEENKGAANAGETAPRPGDSAGSQTGENMNTLEPKDKFNAKLPKSVQQYIDNPPKPGAGFHRWVFGAALRLQGWRPDQVIEEILKAATKACGAKRDPREIADAMTAAARVAAEGGDDDERQAAVHVRRVEGGLSTSAWPELDERLRREVIARSDVKGVRDLEQRSPQYCLATENTEAEDFVDRLFPGNPLICAGKTPEDAHTQPLHDWCGRLGHLTYIVPNVMTARSGVNQQGRESKRCNANTGPRIYIVVEADVGAQDEQAAVIWHLSTIAPLVMVVNSGGKSLHAWFRCEGIDEGDVRRFMGYAVRLGADHAMMTRCQMVRMPYGKRFTGERVIRQEVHYFNPALVTVPSVWSTEDIPPIGPVSMPAGPESRTIEEEGGEYPIPGDIVKQLKVDLAGRYNEMLLAQAVLEILPPIATRNSEWRSWDGKAWVKHESASRFLPTVMRLLAKLGLSTINGAKKILDHVCGLKQSNEDWKGCVAMPQDNLVLINLENGILKVGKGSIELLDHDPDYRFTFAIPTRWVEGAEAPVFEATLASALPDQADRELFQLFAGSILLPSARYEAALAAYGPGGTGKSTLITDGIGHTLGGARGGAVTQLSLKAMCDTNSYSLPKLEYSLVNISAEGDALEVEESSNFKSIISGEPIIAREIYGAPRTIVPHSKLLFASNHMPRFKHGTDAEVRRLRLLHFDQVPKAPDLGLKAKIHAEAEGIFCWMLGGLEKLMLLDSMPSGGEVAGAVSERFSISNDPLGYFVKTLCVVSPTAKVSKELLRCAYEEFAEENGFPPEHAGTFGKRLLHRFPTLRTVKGVGGSKRCYVGIGLRDVSDLPP